MRRSRQAAAVTPVAFSKAGPNAAYGLVADLMRDRGDLDGAVGMSWAALHPSQSPPIDKGVPDCAAR
jgi:hypothetical protein